MYAILDEVTANVDPENEKELMEAISELTQEKTVIMIAHRLKTVRGADQILVVDKGQIVQRGTHEALMTQNGIYRVDLSAGVNKLSVGNCEGTRIGSNKASHRLSRWLTQAYKGVVPAGLNAL